MSDDDMKIICNKIPHDWGIIILRLAFFAI